MRRFVLCVLSGALAALVIARGLLPASADAAVPDTRAYGYNILDIRLPITTETAGSALIAEMNGYWLYRTPTAKNKWTGAAAGKDLILICADNWLVPEEPTRYGAPALYRLERGSARLSAVYRPDWYQGSAGREFALLTGLVPTMVGEETALQWTAEQKIWFPYTLARLLGAQGYGCAAFLREDSCAAAYDAFGFDTVAVASGPAEETLGQTLGTLTAQERFFAYYSWPDEDGEAALEALFSELKAARRLDDTVICLAAGSAVDADRARIFLYGGDLALASSDKPCSELDVTPTLLNLFGLSYDARFLSGRDVFARNDEPGAARSITPVVPLYGSAFSDWVTDAGQYTGEGHIFRQTADCFASSAEVSAYVHAMSRLVYDRYIYARKALESNYFQIVLGA